MNKILRIINFIKNENKFKRTDYVKVLKNTSSLKKYDKYINQKAIVTNIDYDKKDYIVGLKFLDGENINFGINELEKLDAVDEYSKEYTKLLNMI